MNDLAGGLVSGISDFLKVPFNMLLVLGLLVLGTAIFFSGTGEQPPVQDEGRVAVNYFYLPTCPHCTEQRPVIIELADEMPNVSFVMHDASTPEGSILFHNLAIDAGLDTSRLGVPTTFVGKKPFVGLYSKEDIRAEILNCQENCVNGKPQTGEYQKAETALAEFDLPFFGRTDLTIFSLPLLAVVLGIIDGFNPCAMWVLVYLIGLLLNVNDKRKFWLIIGSFVFASGALYFLFMTAWLNAFLLIGYMRPVTILIGIAALGGGILSLKEYITTKGELVCKVGDAESRQKTTDQIRGILSQPFSYAIILPIIALAFVVNSVEFVCSSAIPAVFTQVLAISNLEMLERYAYISLYVLFFMLDDLLIFGLAGFAITRGVGEKYAKYCKLIGGIIMAVLGIIILFAPHLLR